jgi:hypothetical protein
VSAALLELLLLLKQIVVQTRVVVVQGSNAVACEAARGDRSQTRSLTIWLHGVATDSHRLATGVIRLCSHKEYEWLIAI